MHRSATFRIGIFLLMFSCITPLHAAACRSPQDVAFAPDGGTLAVGDVTGASLHLIDSNSHGILSTVPLTGQPSGLAWSADGKRLFAAEAGAGGIAEIDRASGKVTRRFTTGRYPQGLAIAANRNLLLACDYGNDQLIAIDPQTGKTVARIPVGRQPMHVAVSPDESLALVSNLIPATAATAPDHATEVSLVDLTTLAIRAAVRLPTGSTNARGIAIDGKNAHAYVAHTLGRFHLPTTQLDRGWVNTNALSIIDLKTGTRIATVLLDRVMDGAADPWGVAIHPQGTKLYITLSGVHQLATIDLERLHAMIGSDPDAFANDLAALHREKIMRRVDLPAKGPRGIAISPDGRSLALAGYFSGNVIMLDSEAENPVSISLGPQPEPDTVRRGEIAFHDANRCFQRWLSCATCHPAARSDGLNWDLLNDGIGNPKNTRSMLLSHATPPVMSLGVRDKMETAVRAGFIHIQFTQPETGEVEAVIAYLKSLEPATSPHRQPDGSLTASAARGEAIFHRESTGCAQCHPSPLFTDLAMSDVGTSTPRDRGTSAYDTPSLVEAWRNPPFLHDGRAATMREVFTDHNADDAHGVTSTLSPAELDDLIEYLLSL
jgi:YVTN family beta-propeller protein